MKELYLGLCVVALILIILSMTVEASLTGSFTNNSINSKQEKEINAKTLSATNLKNNLPERAYNKNNLNRLFLRKYYNKYFNNLNPNKKFYGSN